MVVTKKEAIDAIETVYKFFQQESDKVQKVSRLSEANPISSELDSIDTYKLLIRLKSYL